MMEFEVETIKQKDLNYLKITCTCGKMVSSYCEKGYPNKLETCWECRRVWGFSMDLKDLKNSTTELMGFNCSKCSKHSEVISGEVIYALDVRYNGNKYLCSECLSKEKTKVEQRLETLKHSTLIKL